MNRLLAALALVGLTTLPVAAQQTVTGRWSVRLRGEVSHDKGDLRLKASGGRVLFESNDTSWLPIEQLEVVGPQVSFRIDGRGLFVGRLEGDWLRGRLHGPDTEPVEFDAQRIRAGTVHWPVRPRVRIRELMVGSAATSSQFSDAWRARLPTRDSLLAEHARLARSVGLEAATLTEIVQRAQATFVGRRPAGHRLAQQIMTRIAAGPAADRRFGELFHPDSLWRLDLHDVAWQIAGAQVSPSVLEPSRMMADLVSAGIVPAVDADTTRLRSLVYQFVRQNDEVKRSGGTLTLPGTERELLGIHTVMLAYDDAQIWWLNAVTWLMQHAWIETESGFRSPVELMREFWDDSTLTLPTLTPTDFGGMQAVPVLGVAPLADRLVAPINGVAAEWLATDDGVRHAFEAWRQIGSPSEAALPVVIGGKAVMMRSPAEVVRSRLGGFIDLYDRILVDPTILPLFAVGTVVHEWQHLRFGGMGLVGRNAPGWSDATWGVRLEQGDPWLFEGAAEWATEQLFRSSLGAMPLFTFLEAEKRLALAAERPDDTHVLGYLLVRTAAERVADADLMRDLLVANLSRPEALAGAIGLAGPVSVPSVRPSTLMLIPELTFVYDGGVAADVSRRLIVPDPVPEPD